MWLVVNSGYLSAELLHVVQHGVNRRHNVLAIDLGEEGEVRRRDEEGKCGGKRGGWSKEGREEGGGGKRLREEGEERERRGGRGARREEGGGKRLREEKEGMCR